MTCQGYFTQPIQGTLAELERRFRMIPRTCHECQSPDAVMRVTFIVGLPKALHAARSAVQKSQFGSHHRLALPARMLHDFERLQCE